MIKTLLSAAVVLTLFAIGCTEENDNDYHFVSYSQDGQLYCVGSSSSRIYVADIVDGGECSEDFVRQGDLYDYIGLGSSFLAPPQEPDCVTQRAYRWNLEEPAFLFIVHSLGEEGVQVVTPEESAIERRSLRMDSTCFIDFWVLPEIQQGDVFEIRLPDREVLLNINDLTSSPGGGTVSGPEPLADEILHWPRDSGA